MEAQADQTNAKDTQAREVRIPIEMTNILQWRMIMQRILPGLWYTIQNWWTFASQNTHREIATTE